MSVRKNVRSTMKDGSSRDQEFLVSVLKQVRYVYGGKPSEVVMRYVSE